MRQIAAQTIKNAVAELCIRANLVLRRDVLLALKKAYVQESDPRGHRILGAIIQNASIAGKKKLAVCQDTGFPTIFLEVGQDVHITGDLKAALHSGIEAGYRQGSLRNSIVKNPLVRGKAGYGPAVLHTDIVRGNKIKITVLPKGFGCENKTQLKMFNPTAKIEAIMRFIVEAVKTAGPDACPPYVVGVGIGGTADVAVFLAKKALLRRVAGYKVEKLHPPAYWSAGCSASAERSQGKNLIELERELLRGINKLKIGSMGLGGRITALGVNIETYPTHIAGLPVAVSISCHALRSASVTL